MLLLSERTKCFTIIPNEIILNETLQDLLKIYVKYTSGEVL